VIAVTCRNGEHFTVDPDAIERIETTPDTVVHLVDGTKYVVSESLDHLLRGIRDHRATLLVVQQQLYGGIAEVADHRAQLRIERRARGRDGDNRSPDAVSPDRDQD
jgi:uncharacterized protein YlzI (FlbEa/FlbD family)